MIELTVGRTLQEISLRLQPGGLPPGSAASLVFFLGQMRAPSMLT